MTVLPHPFVAAVRAELEALNVAGPVFVACSGGGDSLALLRACVELRETGVNLRPIAAHFDHRQRPNSHVDGAFVARHAARWDCDVALGSIEATPGASEATLRTARYAWLASTARRVGATFVLTGHTADDQAETVLLRIVRGTGVSGLTGIPAIGPVPGSRGSDGSLRVVRPMLATTGAEARAFLTERGLSWRDDPSNATPDYTRNRLRHDVLPLLAELNPRVREAMVRLASAARDEAEALAALTDAALEGQIGFSGPQRIELSEARLLALPEPARRAALRRVWRKAGWPEQRMGRADWQRLAALAPGDARLFLPHNVQAVYATGLLVFRR
ncbi:tRNA lysidine(34) synthetase TilS [Alienimonas chondri]|uniref:tRNA(Ile)-lysidine synthase n=1 Tax=Alienimonas chondri TaxID=2681879 RepID=A0ABX1VFW1_9PLAN|nr:tRNA lysidine(34) synthetase TilS [Alienimonas chondri]NNJ26760.1 tRNA(Ile)-lysidine synthase [Alienimonas chondri]